ncbi:MAG: hypothetical protein CMP21_08805 [Rickettsiales bacterium]|nr:hypothetical protein [Rickettsiales bacterium]
MNKVIRINLDTGFDSESDAMLVGANLTKLENFHNLKKGTIIGRKGYGSATEIGGGSNDKLILDLDYWIKGTDFWWFGYDRALGQINRITSDFSTAVSLNTIHTKTASQTVGTGNPLTVDVSNWTGTEPIKYYFKITTNGTPDQFSISTDDSTYTNAQNVNTSLTDVTGANGLKAQWSSNSSSALNDKWEVTLYPLPKRIEMKNWGNAIRFAMGVYFNPYIYQYIDRKFFYKGTTFLYEPTADYDFDTAYPREPSTWLYQPVNADGLKGELIAGGSLDQPKDYYYKITALFDGSQETPMPDDKFGPITTDGSNKSARIKLVLDTNDFNKRITHINIYRADTTSATPDKGAYRLIKTLPFTGEQPSWINRVDAYKGRKVYAYTLGWDPYANLGELTGMKINNNGNVYGGNSFSIPTKDGVNAKFIFMDGDFNDLEGGSDDDFWGTASETMYYYKEQSSMLSPADTCCTGNGVAPYSHTQNSATFTIPSFGTGNNVVVVKVSMYGAQSFATSSYDGCIAGQIKLRKASDGATLGTATVGHGTATGTGYNSASFNVSNSYKSFNIGTFTGDVYITYSYTLNDDSICLGSGYSATYLNSGGTNATIHSVHLRKEYTTDDNAYSGQSIIGVPNLGIGTSEAVGKILKVNGVDYTVTHNEGDLIRVSGNAGWDGATSTSGNTLGGAEVQWEDNTDDGTLSATQKRVVFTDVGEIEGATHSYFGTNSIKTRYKYSASTGNRRFVGNVIIEDQNGTTETYDDMVIYSELNQPDVLPISNFIKLNDQQGGAIFGIHSLFSDIVVFAERGIFRISVPTTDPTSWSMVETERNLGCNQPNSIIEYRGGLFFAGKDNLYYITPNFEFLTISDSWRTEYQTNISSITEIDNTQINIDINNERLIVKCGTQKNVLYIMDLKAFNNQKLLWYKNTLAPSGGDEGEIHSVAVKNDNTFYLLNKMSAQNSTKIRELNPETASGKSHPTLQTGVIFFRSLTDNETAFIRRINFYAIGESGTQTKAYIDVRIDHSESESGMVGGVVADPVISKEIVLGTASDGGGGVNRSAYHSVRIGARAKSVQVKITFKNNTLPIGNTSQGMQIKDLEIEID